jgi:hypothetical protein
MTIVPLADGEAILLTEQGVHYTVRIEKGKHEKDHIKKKWKIQVPNVELAPFFKQRLVDQWEHLFEGSSVS